jgi:hypothetical protein
MLSFFGGSGSNTLVAPNWNNIWALTGNNAGNLDFYTFAAFGNLTGGTGTDNFHFANGAAVTGIIDGGSSGGVNTLDYSAFTTGATVNLATGAATGTGGFRNIGNLVGSSAATDTLTGANVSNTWTITGANAGTLNAFTFSAVENLVGGAATDTFKFTAAGSVAGKVNGGVGANTLDYSGNGGRAIEVNLQTGAATATGGFSNIGALVGSTATTNNLTGANVANTWNLTSNNGGTLDGKVTFSSIENLTGGAKKVVAR